MLSLTGNSRYFVRELFPRTVVIFLCTLLIMPHTPGLAFHGGKLEALSAALFFTAWFSLWGAHIMAVPGVQKFIGGLKNPFSSAVFHTTMMLLIPLLALLFAVFAADRTFVYTEWYGFLVWIVALNACCIATHDYSAP